MKSNHQKFERGSHDRSEILPYIPRDINLVLEVGCGHGAFGKLLKSTHKISEVWGVEINYSAATHATECIDKVIIGDFESQTLALPERYFDCVVFNDVLEHFIDPWSALEYTKSLLKPHGKLVASIPNVRFWGNLYHLLIEQDWKYEDWGIRDRTHLRFFTRKSIVRMMKDCNFRVEVINGINSSAFTIKYRLLKKFFQTGFQDTEFMQFVVVAVVADGEGGNQCL